MRSSSIRVLRHVCESKVVPDKTVSYHQAQQAIKEGDALRKLISGKRILIAKAS